MIRLCSSFCNMKGGGARSQIHLGKKKNDFEYFSLTSVNILEGSITKLQANKWRETSGESQASEMRVYHIAISQRVATCMQTGCKFTTLRALTCEPTCLKVANLYINNFQGCEVNLSRIKCSILKAMSSIFVILYV